MLSPDTHPNLTLFYGIWSALGPLAGILIGYFLTRSWQREQWMRDRKKEEYRELLTGLATSMIDLQDYGISDESRNGFKLAGRIIADRIFIRDDVNALDVGNIYFDAIEDLGNDGDTNRFGERMDVLRIAIIEKAQKL
jgi:hypothetical protein